MNPETLPDTFDAEEVSELVVSIAPHEIGKKIAVPSSIVVYFSDTSATHVRDVGEMREVSRRPVGPS